MTTAYGARLSVGTEGQQLGLSLVNHFLAAGHMAFGEITMGRSGQRADVVMIRKSWNFRVAVFEVKVSRGDFQQDVSTGKYEGYMSHCHQLSFAVPAGLITKADIPAGCGLIVHSKDKGWHTLKAARVRAMDMVALENVGMLFACLMRGYDESLERRSLADRMCLESNVGLADRAVSLGHDIRARLADQQSAWDAIKRVKEAIEAVTGESSRDIHSAIWRLEGFINDIPNPEAFEVAKRLVAIASGLVWNRKGAPEGDYALRQLEEYIEMVKDERGV